MSKPIKLRNIHPGEVLREEFLLPLGDMLRQAFDHGGYGFAFGRFLWHIQRLLARLAGGLRYRGSCTRVVRRAGADTSV